MAARAAGQDAGVAMLALMSWVLWILGHVDEAVSRMAAALERADAVQHAHTHAYAWYYASVLHALRGEPAIAQATRSAVSPYRSNMDSASGSDCRARSGASARPRWMVRQPARRGEGCAWTSISAPAISSASRRNSCCCVRPCSRNEPEAALEVVDHGLSIVSHNSERFFEAELYRLKARMLRMRGAPDAEAESLLEQALRTARSQQARSLELRAATDLARLWMKQGKRAEARDVLSSIYGRFSEGFDTRDLKEAKAVLAQLQ